MESDVLLHPVRKSLLNFFIQRALNLIRVSLVRVKINTD